MRPEEQKDQEDRLDRFIRERIRLAREARGMSQDDLARFLQKTRVTVSDIERGRVRVGTYDLARIAAALEKPVAYFFPDSARGVTSEDLRPDEQEIVEAYRQLADNALQNLALRALKTVAREATQTEPDESDLR